MRKKGFTIVELAVVLVIIGLLLMAATKALAILDAARLKRDVARVHKIQSALLQYFYDNSTLPDRKWTAYSGGYPTAFHPTELNMGDGTLEPRANENHMFFREISEEDSKSEVSNSVWEMILCNPRNVSTSPYKEEYFAEVPEGEFVCLRMANSRTNGELACIIDKEDDASLKTGNARSDGSFDFTASDYEDCSRLSSTYFNFIYRIM